MKKILILLVANLLIFLSLPAQLFVSSMFSDHMVLQRGREIPIWGKGNVGVPVVIILGEDSVEVVVHQDGRWRANLPAQEASMEPKELLIKSRDKSDIFNKQRIVFQDVLIGDVWFASGQSNMHWTVANAANGEAEILNANYPNIRIFQVPRNVSRVPLDEIDAQWQVCTPEYMRDFSAVAYYFGRELYQSENVPIGLIHSSWGGTPSEAWTSLEMLENHPSFKEEIQEIYKSNKDFAKEQSRQAEYSAELIEIVADVEQKNDNTHAQPDLNDNSWSSVNVPSHFDQTDLAGFKGIIWMRKHFSLSDAQSRKELELILGKIEQVDKTYVNGEPVGETFTPNEERQYMVPVHLLRPGDNVIAIRIKHMRNGGGGIYEGPLEILQYGRPIRDLSGEWKYNHQLEHNFPFSTKVYQHLPGTLFNGMIAPVIPYAIKGAIWYQGESNAGRAYQYREIFPMMIHDWRIKWHQGNFPFLFVQLANFMEPKEEPSNDPWPELREAQLMSLSLPNTGMAVTIDIGEADDIHPRNKQDVGKRLALAAQKIAYHKEVVHSGPILTKADIEEGRILLTFDHIGSGLTTKGAEDLKGFAIAGEDGVYLWANAEIIGINQIAVSHPDIREPQTVRYAWANNPICNLYNQEGLPASPFRTDDIRGVTYGKE